MAITAESSSQQLDSRNQLVSKNLNNTNQQVNMDPEPLDFDECFKDSPKFRQNLKDNLAYFDNLEYSMSRTIKQITDYIDTGREHIRAQGEFIGALKVLNGTLGSNNLHVSKRVTTLLGTLEEIKRLHEIVVDQSALTVGASLRKFINDDLLKVKEARKSFDKISHEYDQALTRHSQPVKKQQDDSENLLIATSTAFTHTSLDLSIQLTSLQSKKGFDILSSLLSLTKAHSTFFHQGSDLFEDLKPHINEMDEFLTSIQDEFESLVRSLPSKHLMVSNNELRPLCFDNKAQQVHLEGYLFKRASNGFKVWNRRWFILKDHQLLYQKRGENQPTVMEEDLRLLTVRPVDKADNERRFCFEVLSPHKSHILQADTESACKTWISAIQSGINAAFHDTEHNVIPKSASSNDLQNTAPSSSWGAGFSFRALQQQATSKLNIISNPNELKDHSSKGSSRDKGAVGAYRQSSNTTSCEDENEDDRNSDKCRIDDQGRSYVSLKHDDDDDVNEEKDKNWPRENSTVVNYPTRANNTANNNPPSNNPESASTSSQAVGKAPDKPQRAYMIILAHPGNELCADCGAEEPRWASINLGITLCIQCAGIHRSLGVDVSKVRSLTLDTEVWTPEVVEFMKTLGNSSVNCAYLACYRDQMAPISANSSRELRENWIKSKYLLKSFMRPAGIELNDTLEDIVSPPSEDATAGNGVDSVALNLEPKQTETVAGAMKSSRNDEDKEAATSKLDARDDSKVKGDDDEQSRRNERKGDE